MVLIEQNKNFVKFRGAKSAYQQMTPFRTEQALAGHVSSRCILVIRNHRL